MNGLVAVILVCVLGQPCDVDHARSVMRTPVHSAMPYDCFRDAQAFLAQMQLGELAADEHVRIACTREKHQ